MPSTPECRFECTGVRATASSDARSLKRELPTGRTSAGAWTYRFNLARQLAAASNELKSVSYGYAGDANRIGTTRAGAALSALWDANLGLPQLALERDPVGGAIRRYTSIGCLGIGGLAYVPRR